MLGKLIVNMSPVIKIYVHVTPVSLEYGLSFPKLQKNEMGYLHWAETAFDIYRHTISITN